MYFNLPASQGDARIDIRYRERVRLLFMGTKTLSARVFQGLVQT
jgi:hypothetical protein